MKTRTLWEQASTLIRDIRKNHRNPFLRFSKPGHFYSPLPDLAEIRENRKSLFDRQTRSVPGIETNEAGQLDLLEAFIPLTLDLPFTDRPSGEFRFYYENPYFSYGDAMVLFSMLRHFRPSRIIEIGSGFSSALMLDTNDRFLSGEEKLTFIEPFPERLHSLLGPADRQRHVIIESAVQDVPLRIFDELEARDILFVDSSHVAKIGSDVVHILTHIIPRLKKHVLVHFHDIFWPFEYPEEWLEEGRAWNECYILKSFLQFNPAFKILLFNSYLAIHHSEILTRHFPLFMKNPGGSLWMQKVA